MNRIKKHLKRFIAVLILIIEKLIVRQPAHAAFWLIMLVVVWTNFSLKFWQNPDRLLIWDVKAYYVYLPAVFIYQDLSLDFIIHHRDEIGDAMFLIRGPKDLNYIQTTYGLSLLYAPFFLSAHAFAIISGLPANGYSSPYKFALMISSIFYLAVGLYFLRKFLLKYFDPWLTAITLVVIVLGTNLFYYVTHEAPMAHAYNFSLIASFIYFTGKWYDRARLLDTVIIGFLIGLIVLIRPVNLIIVIFFILWKINSWESLAARFQFLFRSYRWILLMLLISFIIWIPQFIYWKYVSGSYLFYTYSDSGFHFGNPQVFYSLLSYRKGLFVYIPLIFIAFCGIPFLFKRYRGLILPVGIFAAINVYMLSSWCYWWFGGGFGPRSYIDTYAIMAIPFAALTGWMLQRKIMWRVICLLVIFALICFNFFQVRQYSSGTIHHIAMTKEAYWDVFLKRYPTADFNSKLRFPNYESAVKGIYYQDDLTYVEQLRLENERHGIVISDEDLEKELYIRNLTSFIYTQKKWLREIKMKADERGISLDSMIRKDVLWLWEKEKKQREGEKDSMIP